MRAEPPPSPVTGHLEPGTVMREQPEEKAYCACVYMCMCMCVCDATPPLAAGRFTTTSVPLVGRRALLAAACPGLEPPAVVRPGHLGLICRPWITLAALMAALARIKNSLVLLLPVSFAMCVYMYRI